MPNWTAALAAAAFLALSPAFAVERANVTGKVADADGKPVEHATVLVYSAGVRKGYSIYCPTCWVDCGKHSATDAEGNFRISGLDPELVFDLLVVRDGYSSMFVRKVDPEKGPAGTAVIKSEPRRKIRSSLSTERWWMRTADPCATPSWSSRASPIAVRTEEWARGSAAHRIGSTRWR